MRQSPPLKIPDFRFPPEIRVVIPAYNEEKSIGLVVQDIPGMVQEIIVVNNGSTDSTARRATLAGATVLTEERKGYGRACLTALEYISRNGLTPDIVVFLEGDYSDFPEELPKLIIPILEEGMDMVVGARVSRWREKGAMTPPQRFGNRLACTLMGVLFQSPFTDLGPFRAIRYDRLTGLGMQDLTYGWTIEMQLKALKKGYKCREVPVHYRNRIGTSKVSGTVKGATLAGVKILSWIFKYSLR